MQPKSLVLQLIKLKLRVVKVFTQEHTGSSYQSLDTNSSLSTTSPFGLSAIPHCLSKRDRDFRGVSWSFFSFLLCWEQSVYVILRGASPWDFLSEPVCAVLSFTIKSSCHLSVLSRMKYLCDPCTSFWQNTKAQEFVTLKSPSLWSPRYTPNWGLSNFSLKLVPCQRPPGSGRREVKCTMEGSIFFYWF